MTTFYEDLNLEFRPHPLTGDISTIKDVDAVKRALRHIAEMVPYDIPFKPDWHGHIRELLFEPAVESTALALETRIKWAIKKLEPRCHVNDVIVKLASNETGYNITILFHVVSIMDQHETRFYLERLR